MVDYSIYTSCSLLSLHAIVASLTGESIANTFSVAYLRRLVPTRIPTVSRLVHFNQLTSPFIALTVQSQSIVFGSFPAAIDTGSTLFFQTTD